MYGGLSLVMGMSFQKILTSKSTFAGRNFPDTVNEKLFGMQKGTVQGQETPQELLDLVQPHIESFDYFLGEGLQRVVEYVDPVEVSSAGSQQHLDTPSVLAENQMPAG